ncbi:Thiamine biosynthesis lipoprotein ApbE precursor [Planctomycetes bacterium Poly30]|uniref:FAD:protein FMN transferase n=1 Tax=Saltatorellus ferox TaxID=2528018 RepID=A0A518END4_9BACT|nr:Thiamine biosynthesis lipoprotein ApbE precursor [Planctomycetes bacterium Poly30]
MFTHASQLSFLLATGLLALGADRTSPTAISAQANAPIAAIQKLKSAKISFGAMGTDVTIQGYHADAAHLDKALAAARAEIDRIEDLMTSWRDSPLVRMNDGANGEPQHVPQELSDLVERSMTVARLSGGAFDPTYASVGKLWDFKADPPVLPADEAIASALTSVGWQKVQVDTKASTVAMPAGTRIGLGGIAKGYGVDRAMQVLIDHGIEHGIVNAGGDLKALGTDDGKPWEVAIKHPRDRERAIAVVPVSNVCLVTSGDYERFFELDGVRYHHIFDPRTGRPVVGGCMSATVTAPDAAIADAVATACCVLGPELGLRFIESLPRIDAILVDIEGQVHVSSGLETAVRK